MDNKSKTFQTEPERYDESYSFHVTVESIVGEVTVDPYGDGPSPREAAFALIAKHGTTGTFEFPLNPDWSERCVVFVEHRKEAR